MAKKITIAVSVIIALLLGVGVWWLFDTGRLVYSQNPEQIDERVAIVCDEEMVTRYSDAAKYTIRDGAEEPSIDKDGLNAVRDDVSKLDGNANDPTCQLILFQVAVQNDDYEAAKLANDSLIKLHADGRFPNNNVLGIGTLSQNDSYLQGLTGYDGLTGLEDEVIE